MLTHARYSDDWCQLNAELRLELCESQCLTDTCHLNHAWTRSWNWYIYFSIQCRLTDPSQTQTMIIVMTYMYSVPSNRSNVISRAMNLNLIQWWISSPKLCKSKLYNVETEHSFSKLMYWSRSFCVVWWGIHDGIGGRIHNWSWLLFLFIILKERRRLKKNGTKLVRCVIFGLLWCRHEIGFLRWRDTEIPGLISADERSLNLLRRLGGYLPAYEK